MVPQECEVGDEVHIKVSNKGTWARKEVEIGVGSCVLSAELVSCLLSSESASGFIHERADEIKVEVFKKNRANKLEHTGDIMIALGFSELSRSLPYSGGRPGLNGSPSPGLSEDFSKDLTRPDHATSSDAAFRSEAELGPPMLPMSQRQQSPPQCSQNGVGSLPEQRLAVVTHQYWERDLHGRKSQPVLCTTAVLHYCSVRRKEICCYGGFCGVASASAAVAAWLFVA